MGYASDDSAVRIRSAGPGSGTTLWSLYTSVTDLAMHSPSWKVRAPPRTGFKIHGPCPKSITCVHRLFYFPLRMVAALLRRTSRCGIHLENRILMVRPIYLTRQNQYESYQRPQFGKETSRRARGTLSTQSSVLNKSQYWFSTPDLRPDGTRIPKNS